MFEWIASPEAWVALATLTALEIVLGIDNIIFISILVGRLPAACNMKGPRVPSIFHRQIGKRHLHLDGPFALAPGCGCGCAAVPLDIHTFLRTGERSVHEHALAVDRNLEIALPVTRGIQEELDLIITPYIAPKSWPT